MYKEGDAIVNETRSIKIVMKSFMVRTGMRAVDLIAAEKIDVATKRDSTGSWMAGHLNNNTAVIVQPHPAKQR